MLFVCMASIHAWLLYRTANQHNGNTTSHHHNGLRVVGHHVVQVKALCEAKVDVNMESNDGDTALLAAATNGTFDAVSPMHSSPCRGAACYHAIALPATWHFGMGGLVLGGRHRWGRHECLSIADRSQLDL